MLPSDESLKVALRSNVDVDLPKIVDEEETFTYEDVLSQINSPAPLEDRPLLHQSVPVICYACNLGPEEGSRIYMTLVVGGQAAWTRVAQCAEEVRQIECLHNPRAPHVSVLTCEGNVFIYRVQMDDPDEMKLVRTYRFPKDEDLKPIKAGWHASPDWLFVTFHKEFMALHDIGSSEVVTVYDSELSMTSKCKLEKYTVVRRVASLHKTIPGAAPNDYKTLIQFRDFCFQRIGECDRLFILFTEGHVAVYNAEETNPLCFRGVFRLETTKAQRFMINGQARSAPLSHRATAQYAIPPLTAEIGGSSAGRLEPDEWRGKTKGPSLQSNAMCVETQTPGEFALYDLVSWNGPVARSQVSNAQSLDNCRVSPVLSTVRFRQPGKNTHTVRFSPVFTLDGNLTFIVERTKNSRSLPLTRIAQFKWVAGGDLQVKFHKAFPGTRAILNVRDDQYFLVVPSLNPADTAHFNLIDSAKVTTGTRPRHGSAAVSASSSGAPSREPMRQSGEAEDDNEGDVESSPSSSDDTEEELVIQPDNEAADEMEDGVASYEDKDFREIEEEVRSLRESPDRSLDPLAAPLTVPPGFSSPLEKQGDESERIWGAPNYTLVGDSPKPQEQNVSLDGLATLIVSKLESRIPLAQPVAPSAQFDFEELSKRLDRLVSNQSMLENSTRITHQVERVIQQSVNSAIKSLSESLSHHMSNYVCQVILKGIEETLEERLGSLTDTVKSSMTAASEEVGKLNTEGSGVSEEILNSLLLKTKNDILGGVAKQMSTLQQDHLSKTSGLLKSALQSKLSSIIEDVAEIRQTMDLQKDTLVQQFSSQLERLFEQQRSMITEQFLQNRATPSAAKDNTELIDIISENSSSMKAALENLRIQFETMRQNFLEHLQPPISPAQRRSATMGPEPTHYHHTVPPPHECVDCVSEMAAPYRCYHSIPPPSASSRTYHPEYHHHHHHELSTPLEMPTCAHRTTRSQYGGPSYTDRSYESVAGGVPPLRPTRGLPQYDGLGTTASTGHQHWPASASTIYGRPHGAMAESWAPYGGRLAPPSSSAIRTSPNVPPQGIMSTPHEDQLVSSRSAHDQTYNSHTTDLSQIDLSNLKEPVAEQLLKHIGDGELDTALYHACSKDNDDKTHGFWTILATRHINVKDERLKDKTSIVVAVVKVLSDSMAACFQHRADEITTRFRLETSSGDHSVKRVPMASVVNDVLDVPRRANWITHALMNVNIDEVALSSPEKMQLTTMIERAVRIVQRSISDGGNPVTEALRSPIRESMKADLKVILALCERLVGTRT